MVLYMVDQLLRPGHAEHVVGLAPLKAALEAVMGPMSPQALASEIFGLYGGLVYFTPIVGGMVGDRWLGQRRTVMIGAVLMAAGHLLMSLEGRLPARPAAADRRQRLPEGQQSPPRWASSIRPTTPLRTRAYAVFNVGVNAGGLLGPLVCGAIGETLGWRYGFAAAGVMMVVALATYWAGRRWMPPDRRVDGRAPKEHLTARDWRTVAALLAMLVLGCSSRSRSTSSANTYLIWISGDVDRSVSASTSRSPGSWRSTPWR